MTRAPLLLLGLSTSCAAAYLASVAAPRASLNRLPEARPSVSIFGRDATCIAVGAAIPSPPPLRSAQPPAATTSPTAPELYERAVLLQQMRRRDESLRTFERLAELTPGDGRVWMRMMTLHKLERRWGRAEATLRRGIEALPQNALLRQALGDLCRERQRWDEARAHFAQAARLDPQLRSVYDSWGRMEASLGRHTLAAELLQRGLELEPTARTYHALGVLQDSKLGQRDRARETLRRGLRLPDEHRNPQLLHALGKLEAAAGNAPAARAHYLAAIDAAPSFTMAHLALGKLEEGLGRYETAARVYAQGATTLQPDGGMGPVQLWQSWARMEQRRGRPLSARRLYERACRHHPKDARLLSEWARLAAELGDPAQARAIFSRVLALRPAPPAYAWRAAAALQVREGNISEARELFVRGVSHQLRRLRPGDNAAAEAVVPLVHAWAVCEWKHGAAADARALFRRAELLAPSPCAWVFLWRARFEASCGEAGSHHLARHYYARAVNAAPFDPMIWRLWAELEAAHGDAPRAALYSKRSQEVETLSALRERSDASPSPSLRPPSPAAPRATLS